MAPAGTFRRDFSRQPTPTEEQMDDIIPRSADAVIIGAGVVGASIAYHLAARGCTDIVVLERNRIAQGASGDGAGGFRQQFSTPINVRMTQLSLPYFLDAPARLGTEVETRRQGYLFLLTDEAAAAAYREGLAMQQGLGAPVRWLEPREVAALAPGLRTAAGEAHRRRDQQRYQAEPREQHLVAPTAEHEPQLAAQ